MSSNVYIKRRKFKILYYSLKKVTEKNNTMLNEARLLQMILKFAGRVLTVRFQQPFSPILPPVTLTWPSIARRRRLNRALIASHRRPQPAARVVDTTPAAGRNAGVVGVPEWPEQCLVTPSR